MHLLWRNFVTTKINVKCLRFSRIINHEITKFLNTIICDTVYMQKTALKDLVKYDSENCFMDRKHFDGKESLGHIDSRDMQQFNSIYDPLYFYC